MSIIQLLHARGRLPDLVIAFCSALVALAPMGAHGQADAEGATSQLVVTVISAADSAPVANAQIIVTGAGPDERHGTTEADGTATFLKLPRAAITVRVIATGFDPGGATATLAKAEEAITVKIKKSALLPPAPGS